VAAYSSAIASDSEQWPNSSQNDLKVVILKSDPTPVSHKDLLSQQLAIMP